MSTRFIHANCFVPAGVQQGADVLLTDETLVASAASPTLAVLAPETHIDAELAHTTSAAMQRAAFDWFRTGANGTDDDPSMVAGISAGDLAGHEAAHTILMPAARGALAMAAVLANGCQPTELISLAPGGSDRYAQLETLAADAAIAVARARLGARLTIARRVCDDARNALLRDKYARTRDVDYVLTSAPHRRFARAAALRATNAAAVWRRRELPALLVLEYNPSHAFARAYGARRERRWRLVCWPASARDLLAIARHGDEAIVLSTHDLHTAPATDVERRVRAREPALNGTALRVAEIDLWPVVREPLLRLLERYGRYAAAQAPLVRRELERRKVHAVLVPFDMPAHARLIVRVAQAMGIATFVINDGYKADEIQLEGMTADVAFVWSRAIGQYYYARRANGAIVTGDPRATCAPPPARTPSAIGQRARWRVLVGGHTFSPVDINCGRSDAERFLDEILAALATSEAHVSRDVIVKLHSADATSYYRDIVARHARLEVLLLAQGDVTALFPRCDVYVTTYSTSLLQAIAAGVPAIYYRVNAQRLGPPFTADEFLARRTATSPAELAALLRDRDGLTAAAPDGWVERYLGPDAGAVDRIVASIEQHTGVHVDAPRRVARSTNRMSLHPPVGDRR